MGGKRKKFPIWEHSHQKRRGLSQTVVSIRFRSSATAYILAWFGLWRAPSTWCLQVWSENCEILTQNAHLVMLPDKCKIRRQGIFHSKILRTGLSQLVTNCSPLPLYQGFNFWKKRFGKFFKVSKSTKILARKITDQLE